MRVSYDTAKAFGLCNLWIVGKGVDMMKWPTSCCVDRGWRKEVAADFWRKARGHFELWDEFMCYTVFTLKFRSDTAIKVCSLGGW